MFPFFSYLLNDSLTQRLTDLLMTHVRLSLLHFHSGQSHPQHGSLFRGVELKLARGGKNYFWLWETQPGEQHPPSPPRSTPMTLLHCNMGDLDFWSRRKAGGMWKNTTDALLGTGCPTMLSRSAAVTWMHSSDKEYGREIYIHFWLDSNVRIIIVLYICVFL